MKSIDFKLLSDVNLIKNFKKNRDCTFSVKLLIGKFYVFHAVVSVQREIKIWQILAPHLIWFSNYSYFKYRPSY